MPMIPLPIPRPIPFPIPQPVIPVPSPNPSAPSPGTGIPIPGGSGGSGGGSFTQPFADLFNFDVNWKYVASFIGLAITVYLADGYSPSGAIVYVIILLLGIILIDGRFGPELERIAGR